MIGPRLCPRTFVIDWSTGLKEILDPGPSVIYGITIGLDRIKGHMQNLKCFNNLCIVTYIAVFSCKMLKMNKCPI